MTLGVLSTLFATGWGKSLFNPTVASLVIQYGFLGHGIKKLTSDALSNTSVSSILTVLYSSSHIKEDGIHKFGDYR